MKRNMLCVLMAACLLSMTACGREEKPALVNTEATEGKNTATEDTDEGIVTENTADEAATDDAVYIGEYLDSDAGEPNLEIAIGEDGKYIVQIGIYRLTTLDDGVGELTDDGMRFTATDAAGNPIAGIITVEGKTAIVTFTDSTWGDLQNGASFQYTKSSDIPNIR